jgi:DNA-directed RNA polymerase beta' subunit
VAIYKAEDRVAQEKSSTSDKGKSKVHKVMKEYKEGDLKSGKNRTKVKSRKQAVAIALSEARKSGAKIPKKKK